MVDIYVCILTLVKLPFTSIFRMISAQLKDKEHPKDKTAHPEI